MAFSPSTARHATAITPSDTTVVVHQAVYIGAAGSLAVVTTGGEEITFAGLNAGTILPVSVRKVLNTGTTASSLIGLND